MGIGIGVPGPVDFSAGTVVSPPIMPGWDRYPIIETVQQWFPHANVVVDNDVNVMALGEVSLGAARGVSNLISVKIGTGIGAGIICDGKHLPRLERLCRGYRSHLRGQGRPGVRMRQQGLPGEDRRRSGHRGTSAARRTQRPQPDPAGPL